MTADCLISELTDGILRLTLNEPHKRNALSEAMMAGLSERLRYGETNQDVRVIILAAIGPVFCAGHDLKEMTAARVHPDKGRAYYEKMMGTCSSLMQSIVHHPKPVIAEVDGIASAAGCQLVASCDLAFASRTAKFATPGVQIGLFCSTPMVALSRNISRKQAIEMLLTGDMINAERAMEFGLVNCVVDQEQLAETVMTTARKIAQKSAMTLKIGKKAFYEQIEMSLADAYDHASAVMVENMLNYDAEEGINAFIEKRDPEWKDK